MFLLLLCLGTNSSTELPSELLADLLSAPLVWVRRGSLVPPLQSLYDGPLRSSAPRPPLLHHQNRVAGRGGCRQPPQGLHGRGRHAWQSASPRQTAGFAPRRSCRNQTVLVFRPTGFFTFTSSAATRRSWNRFPTRRGGFCTPRTGGAFTGATDVVPVPSTGTATEVRPLTSSPSGRGQARGEPCGHLPTPLVGGQTSRVYSSNAGQYMYSASI